MMYWLCLSIYAYQSLHMQLGLNRLVHTGVSCISDGHMGTPPLPNYYLSNLKFFICGCTDKKSERQFTAPEVCNNLYQTQQRMMKDNRNSTCNGLILQNSLQQAIIRLSELKNDINISCQHGL